MPRPACPAVPRESRATALWQDEPRFTYTGQTRDPLTGLAHFRARDYDPAAGRFLVPDPLGLAAGDPNLYRYVGNRPLDLTDPSGLAAYRAKDSLGNPPGPARAGTASVGVAGLGATSVVDWAQGVLAASGPVAPLSGATHEALGRLAWGGTAVVAPGFDFGFSRLVASPFVPSTPAPVTTRETVRALAASARGPTSPVVAVDGALVRQGVRGLGGNPDPSLFSVPTGLAELGAVEADTWADWWRGYWYYANPLNFEADRNTHPDDRWIRGGTRTGQVLFVGGAAGAAGVTAAGVGGTTITAATLKAGGVFFAEEVAEAGAEYVIEQATGLSVPVIVGPKGGAKEAGSWLLRELFQQGGQKLAREAPSLAVRLEANAARRLAEIQADAGPTSHFLSRHGAQTTIEQQYLRSTRGITPDGLNLRPADSGRFLSHRAQLNAVQSAQEIYQRTGKKVFTFDAGYEIGEGFLRDGTDLVRTSNVRAVFDSDGNITTLFPFLNPLP